MPLCKILEKMQYCFIPLVTLLALEKLVPANLVDRTVQQAGNIGTGKKKQKHWKNQNPKKDWKNKKKQNAKQSLKKHIYGLLCSSPPLQRVWTYCIFSCFLFFPRFSCFLFCFFFFFCFFGFRPPPKSVEVICGATLQRVCK